MCNRKVCFAANRIRRFSLLMLLLSLVTAVNVMAQNTQSTDITPNDEMFIDMAVSAAKTSRADGGLPCGAVVVMNGSWRSTGMPNETATAEEVAISKSRSKSLSNGALYTVVQPTTKACQAIAASGLSKVYYVIDANTAIAAGIHKAADYENAPQLQAELIRIPSPEAEALIK